MTFGSTITPRSWARPSNRVLSCLGRSASEGSLASDPSEAERLKQESTRFEGRAHERGVMVEPKVIYSTQWESEALRESAEASLLMIRATSPGGLRKFALGPVEDRIVKLAKCPVLILRKGT